MPNSETKNSNQDDKRPKIKPMTIAQSNAHTARIARFQKKYLKEHDVRTNTIEIIKYLGIDLENPNTGTRNKRRLMEKVLILMRDWKACGYDDAVNRLSLRTNMSVRAIRENYVDPLIAEGLIKKIGSQIVFVGLPDEGDQ